MRAINEHIRRNPNHILVLSTSYVKTASRFLTGGDKAGRLNKFVALHENDREIHPYDPRQDRVSYTELQLLLGNALRSARVLDKEISRGLNRGRDWWQDSPLGFLVPAMRFARNVTEHEGAELMRWASRGEQEMRREWISEVTWAPFDAGQRGRFGEAEYTQWLNGQGIAMILWILATPLLTGTIWTMGDELPRSNPPLHREAGKMEIDFKFWTAAQRFLPQDVWVRIMSQKFVDSQFCPAKMSAYLGSLISSRTLEDWHEPLYV